MLKIAQYENLLSIYIIIVTLIPCIVLCLLRKKSKILDLLLSLVLISTILGSNSLQLAEFVAFVLFETLVVYFFLFFRRRCSSELIYFIVLAISFGPFLFVRLSAFSVFFQSIIGFTGISYMCFKIWQIIFEIHDGKIDKLNIVDFLSFLLFIPSFSVGPIARYQDFKDSYDSPNLEKYFEEYFSNGIKKVLIGAFYKFALAYLIYKYVIGAIPEGVNAWNVLLYMYAYTVYLFFDFAGYSNMAVGFGMVMGVKLPENFNKPFLARNIKEFWNRWHMSLSSWFNDYVFGRFVLNNIRNGLFKSTKTASRVAYIFTMLVMGLWHGFSLHYVIYGLYEGILLVITDYWLKTKVFKRFKKKKYYSIVSRVICFQFISFGMLLFSGHYFFEG